MKQTKAHHPSSTKHTYIHTDTHACKVCFFMLLDRLLGFILLSHCLGSTKHAHGVVMKTAKEAGGWEIVRESDAQYTAA